MYELKHSLLLVSAMEDVEDVARQLSREVKLTVVVARTSRAAAAALRREEFTVVVCDTSLVRSEDFEVLCGRMGFAVPLEVDLARVGVDRLIRRLRSVLERRDHETLLARRAAAHAINDRLRQQVTGLLLQSDLLLCEKSLPRPLVDRLQLLREMADGIRMRLQNV